MFGADVDMRFNLDPRAIAKAMDSAKMDAMLYAKSVQIQNTAMVIFSSQRRGTHGVTPPPYVTSFRIDRVRGLFGNHYRVKNTDPAAFWVEMGAYLHHPTHPRILRYKPLQRAIDAVAAGE